MSRLLQKNAKAPPLSSAADEGVKHQESRLKYLSVLFTILISSVAFSHEKTIEGSSLYLVRSGFETHRAEFNYAQDCQLIAKTMNEKEPNVKWLCSTSEKPREFDCNLKGVTIVNTDKNTKEVMDFSFKLSLNRGKATTTLTAAVSSFHYAESGKIIKLTNDYPYVSGNYYSSAITYLTIESEKLNLKAINFDLQDNGSGNCAIVK